MMMIMPTNKTESEVVAIIDKVVNKIAAKYKFGYYDVDDIKQEARRLALEGLKNYDESRPLENFLSSHVKNRLINFKRDKYKRNDPPCKLCHNANDGITKHADGKFCPKYIAWQKRNTTKQNIMNFLDISNICDERETRTRVESNVLEEVEIAEILQIIDEKLPVELRSVYLQMRAGVSVPKAKRREVEQAIIAIVGEDVCPSSRISEGL